MFYDAVENRHGLRHDPFKALVTPRPIGWISTRDADGRPNLAPYSFFNAVSDNPHIVAFSSSGLKHSASNAAETGEFVCNLATFALRDAMNRTSAPFPAGVDEMREAGLTPAPCRLVRPPRVAESPAALECRVLQTIDLAGLDGRGSYVMVIGQVVGIHIDPACIVDGLVDITRMQPIARLGYHEYSVVDAVFRMTRPGAA